MQPGVNSVKYHLYIRLHNYRKHSTGSTRPGSLLGAVFVIEDVGQRGRNVPTVVILPIELSYAWPSLLSSTLNYPANPYEVVEGKVWVGLSVHLVDLKCACNNEFLASLSVDELDTSAMIEGNLK